MIFIFWLSLATLIYHYAGYPVLLAIGAIVFKRKVRKKASFPKVSVVLSAFNEEKHIERKLQNLLALDYPPDHLEILVGSDGASDTTDDIISSCPSLRVRFFKFVRNMGKPSVLNELVNEARGSIVVFTDSRQEFDAAAVRELAANFEDPEVGAVSGELYFKAENESQEKGAVGRGMGAYWKYEKYLRKKESEIGTMLSATGAIYAIRKKLWRGVPEDILVDDMYIPLSIVAQGYRVVFDSEAKAYDRISDKGKQEFRRKVRTLTGNYQIFACFPYLFNPFTSRVAWQFFSHRFLRVAAPFLLIAVFAANLFLVNRRFYLLTMAAQVLFYMVAVFEVFQSGQKRNGPGYLPYMFCLLNLSAFVALMQFLRGSSKVTWGKAYK